MKLSLMKQIKCKMISWSCQFSNITNFNKCSKFEILQKNNNECLIPIQIIMFCTLNPKNHRKYIFGRKINSSDSVFMDFSNSLENPKYTGMCLKCLNRKS